jgi:hypothetical protein
MIWTSSFENATKCSRFDLIFTQTTKTRFSSREVFLTMYQRKIENDIRKRSMWLQSRDSNLLIFFKNILISSILNCLKSTRSTKRLTIKRVINNYFNYSFKPFKNANVKKIVELSKVLQFDKNLAFLSEDRDNSSNQCYCISNRVEKDHSFEKKNRIDIELYQEESEIEFIWKR